MSDSAPRSPSPTSPASSAILSPSSHMTLSSDLSAASPQQIYKLASKYFLTKHFPEAAVAVEPLLHSIELKWQQKVWGLYVVILDNGLRVSAEEGRKAWGRQVWEGHVRRVRSGAIWDELLESYHGERSDIDAEVIVAMIQISLHHGDTKVAQLRVEEWLAAVPPPYPFPSDNVSRVINGHENGHRKTKDHYSTILELYILSLLPRNGEWEFAREFIATNEYLSDVKKRTHLARLKDLKEAQERAKSQPPIIQPTPQKATPKSKLHAPTSSTSTTTDEDLIALPPSPTSQSPFPPTTSSATPTPTHRTISTLATRFLRNPARVLRHFLSQLQELSQDDSFLRTLLFAIALVVALLRRDVRARLRLGAAWLGRKVRETIAMGSKVGYL